MTSVNHAPLLVLSDSRRATMATQLRTLLARYVGEDVVVGVHSISEFRQQVKDHLPGALRSLHAGLQEVSRCFLADTLLQDVLTEGGRSSLSQTSAIAFDVQSQLHGLVCAQLASLWRLTPHEDASSRSLRDVVADSALAQWFVCVATRPAHPQPLLAIFLSAAIVDQWVPRARSAVPEEKVLPRKAAIRDNDVRVDVVLGDVDVGCVDLTQLAVGDVLVLNQELTSPAKLQSIAGTFIAKVQVGRVGERLGVHING